MDRCKRMLGNCEVGSHHERKGLGSTFGDPSLWETLIQPAMKHIAICTAKCAQERMKCRKGSCQVNIQGGSLLVSPAGLAKRGACFSFILS